MQNSANSNLNQPASELTPELCFIREDSLPVHSFGAILMFIMLKQSIARLRQRWTVPQHCLNGCISPKIIYLIEEPLLRLENTLEHSLNPYSENTVLNFKEFRCRTMFWLLLLLILAPNPSLSLTNAQGTNLPSNGVAGRQSANRRTYTISISRFSFGSPKVDDTTKIANLPASNSPSPLNDGGFAQVANAGNQNMNSNTQNQEHTKTMLTVETPAPQGEDRTSNSEPMNPVRNSEDQRQNQNIPNRVEIPAIQQRAMRPLDPAPTPAPAPALSPVQAQVSVEASAPSSTQTAQAPASNPNQNDDSNNEDYPYYKIMTDINKCAVRFNAPLPINPIPNVTLINQNVAIPDNAQFGERPRQTQLFGNLNTTRYDMFYTIPGVPGKTVYGNVSVTTRINSSTPESWELPIKTANIAPFYGIVKIDEAKNFKNWQGFNEAIYREMNEMRTNPSEYAKKVEAQMATFLNEYEYYDCGLKYSAIEGKSVWVEAIDFLRNQKPLPALRRLQCLDCSSNYMVNDVSRNKVDPNAHLEDIHAAHRDSRGELTSNRTGISCLIKTGGENVAAGTYSAESTILQLLIDDNVVGRGHRVNMFANYTQVGIATAYHEQLGSTTVHDFLF